MEIIEKDLESTLKQNNINYIKCLGLKFDPNFHQAVGQKESDKEEGTIIEEVQKGYTLYERLLRPSMVYVAKNPKNKYFLIKKIHLLPCKTQDNYHIIHY